MAAVRRYVFPILWLVVFAVIAAALFKLAFIDGMRADAAAVGEQPSAQLTTPLVPAALGTVTNLVAVQGSVISDPLVSVRSTAEGTVEFIYVEAGQNVLKGEPLFQVKTLLELPEPVGDEPGPAAPPAYAYNDVVATAAGTVAELMVLPKQQLTVGAEAASLDPGTYSVTGTLTSDQQFRILDRTNTARVSINGGPAPFPCSNVSMGGTPATDTGVNAQAQRVPAGPGQEQPEAAGSVRCTVPADVPVFAGLGATIEITAGHAENVVTVPTTAVRGSVQTGIVWVAPGEAGPDSAGDAVEREVGLGLNDGSTVEIVSGLAEGEMVLQFVPGAAADIDPMTGMPGVMGG
ncbi:secretion protein HlyD [Arthrobacter sp. YD2]|uniref:secretion protein HlyD n=1 Tax=Arthrobacter sp. YD2 TaxID=3058046 RepID=UPI0025B51390|nr:secretion protein HlyD [Arthrobacter sp. YD2]MDN3904062.1 secretion protein HlyD [Arthrobacter sp. YD2]